MKKNIIKILKIMIVFFICIGMTNVYAANDYSCNLLITGDKTIIKAGESITYEIKATNIDAETGIIIFETLLEYDSEIFECSVNADQNGVWNKTSLIDNYLTMTRSDYEASSEDQVIATLTLIAKNDVTANDYTVKLSNIKFTMDNDKYFDMNDQTINIKVVSNSENNIDINTPTPTTEPIITPTPTTEPIITPTPTTEPIITPTPTTEPITTPTPSTEINVIPTESKIIIIENKTNESVPGKKTDMNASNNDIKNEQNTNNNSKLPYTGTLGRISIIIITFMVILMTVYFFIKYRNINF